MTLNYFETDPVSSLVENIFCLNIEEADLPFTSKILPFGHPSITYVYGKGQNAYRNKQKMPLEKLIITVETPSEMAGP